MRHHVHMADRPKSPRQRAREQAIRDIKRIARRQLTTEGSSGLSLRAIARELGIVSSAVYRYVPSRDELLTMLIEDAYNALGDAAEKADRDRDPDDVRGRWMAIGRAIRAWAVKHPSDYALVYGSPVPGYAAPRERTIEPGTRVSALLMRLFADHQRTAERLPEPAPIPRTLHRDLAGIRKTYGADVGDDLLARGILAWTALFGLVSFELFGQYVGGFADYGVHFDHQMARLADYVGLPA
jgi:AcrR family transcriptional regulator